VFRDVFTREIVPLIERRYQVAESRRTLMGLSRSTVGALDACVNGGVRFAACALLAPAVAPAQLPALLRGPAAGPRFLIETGTYDIPLVTDARVLRRSLEARHFTVSYVESPQGHNHTAFRARLPALLRALFPPEERF
jgi:enterochelin esterase-like enzyme